MDITKELIAASIALLGILLSVTISFLTSRKTINIELKKLRLQTQQIFANKLLESRLALYPELYSFLSNFSKELRRRKLSRNSLEGLLERVDKWDSENSIFFSGNTVNICNRFRNEVLQLIDEDDDLERKLSSEDTINSLWHRIAEFELALKSEIGIYGFANSEDEIKTKLITNY